MTSGVRQRDTGRMAPAVGTDSLEPEDPSGCWCCGDRTVQGSLLRLGDHPEVGVCFRCVKVLVQRRREIERRTRRAVLMDRPLWRRVQYRLGFGPC
jgi:hypothetical protein